MKSNQGHLSNKWNRRERHTAHLDNILLDGGKPSCSSYQWVNRYVLNTYFVLCAPMNTKSQIILTVYLNLELDREHKRFTQIKQSVGKITTGLYRL